MHDFNNPSKKDLFIQIEFSQKGKISSKGEKETRMLNLLCGMMSNIIDRICAKN